MKTCELILPYPPSVNNYKKMGKLRTTKSGKLFQPRINTNKTNQFYFEVIMKTLQQGRPSFAGATISVEVDVYPPDKRKRDIDNPVKPLLDALQKANLFNDDSQIARLLLQRMNIIRHGQVIVRISAL